MIAEAGLSPGDRLPSERELMAELGVGRSAVREAMLALQRSGIVAVSSGERARVAEPSARGALEELGGLARVLIGRPGGAERLREVLVLLEVGLARLAARRATAGDLAMLAGLLEAEPAAGGDSAAETRADLTFRYGVATVARNELLTTLLESLTGWLAGELPAGTGRAGRERILDAIAARDPEASARAVEEHLGAVSPGAA